MSFSIQQIKSLLVKMFRMTLATAERRHEDAVQAFSDILDLTIEQQQTNCCDDNISMISSSDSYCGMPSLVPLNTPQSVLYEGLNKMMSQRDDDTVKLVISEEISEAKGAAPAPAPAAATAPAVMTSNVLTEQSQSDDDEMTVDEEQEQEQEQSQEEQSQEEQEQEQSQEEQSQEEQSQEQSQEEQSQEQELELVPVRIKKVTYWKDEPTGDIYQYLSDDECGDKVGTYVDGKPVFDM